MKVSRKAYYGLRAILALSQAKKPLSVHEISAIERLPEDYMEKILQALRRAGLVDSHKGVTGGYALARPAEKINVWEIMLILDGPIRTFAPPVKGELPCFQVSHCQTNEVWRTLEKKIEETLSGISLEALSRASVRS